MTIHNIDHIYILCDKSYELNRYNFLLNWAGNHFDPSYFSFNMYCYKDTIHKKDILKYGIVEDRLKPSEISLFINYMKIFEDIIDKYSNKKNSHFLILESDIIPQDNWKIILNKQMELLNNKPFDFLHIGNGGNNDFLPSLFGHLIKNNDCNVFQCPSARCTEAMIWSYDGARKYLSLQHKPVIHPLDFYFNTIAANGVKSIDETKTYWGHPVAFIQGTANGTYESTVNDSITVPKRLSFYNKQINIHFDKDLFNFEDIIKHIIKTAFPDTHVTHYPNRKAQLLVTSTPSKTHSYILIHQNNNIPNTITKNDPLKVLELSTFETFEKNIFHIPEVCLSPLVWQLDKLSNRSFSDKKHLSISSDNKTQNDSILYIIKNVNENSSANTNSIFRLCVEEEYHPGNLSSQILDAYFNGCIPVVYSCNITLNNLFEDSTYINLTKFKNDNHIIKMLKTYLNKKERLQSFFNQNPIKQNTILTWAYQENNPFMKNISKYFYSSFNSVYSTYVAQLSQK